MRLPILFFTAIITPILLCASLLLPSYASIYGAAYIIYTPQTGENPLAGKYDEVFTIIDTYQSLLNYFLANQHSLGFVEYTLPIMVLPLGGCLFSLWLTYKIARRLLNFFQLSATIN